MGCTNATQYAPDEQKKSPNAKAGIPPGGASPSNSGAAQSVKASPKASPGSARTGPVAPIGSRPNPPVAESTLSGTVPSAQSGSAILARRNVNGLSINPSSKSNEKCGVKKVAKISELYTLGKEVMPSSNPGMEVRFATRVSDGAEMVIKTRGKKDSFVNKEDESFWLQSTEMLLNIPKSENIAQIHDLIDDGSTYYIVMEKAEGVDLYEVLSRDGLLDLDTVKDILRQLLQALQELHAKGCVHRDIKLENVVVDTPESPQGSLPGRRARRPSISSNNSCDSISSQTSVKLIDFDTVETFSPQSRAREVVGTDQYIAREAYEGRYSPASDVFSVGVIAYRLIAGKFPFKTSMFDDQPGENWVGSPQMKAIGNRLRNFKIDFTKSPWPQEPDAKDLTEWMLKDDGDDRPTAVQALAHRFLLQF